jgi:hypothetical protein
MLVRMIGEVSGTRDGAPWPGIGREIDLPTDEAVPLIQARMAVPAVDPERVEVAVPPDAAVEVRVDDKPEMTDPSVVVSNEARAEQRAALVKGNRRKVNPDIA